MTNYPQADDPLVAEVWQVMRWRIGFVYRIDRALLSVRVFGKYSDNNDRKIRDALTELPVVWDDGYFLFPSMKKRRKATLPVCDQDRRPLVSGCGSWMNT